MGNMSNVPIHVEGILLEAASSSGAASVVKSCPLPSQYIEEFEKLNKWKGCLIDGAPERFVYAHNRARAAGSGFPTSLAMGLDQGLTEHEVAAIFGWSTGDYRMINPIARGQSEVAFEDYPFLPNKLTKATCVLSRDDVIPYVHVLSSALSKLPPLANNAQRLWRGHRRYINAEVGSTIVLRGFTSVTRDRDNALAFAAKPNEGTSSQRTLISFVEHFSGRCISKLSARRDEMEVMFPLDTTFEVVPRPDYDDDDDDSDDISAVLAAKERLKKTIPDVDINLVYLKEVKVDDWS
mmetsp:Transcript_12843/g.17194  ORF Transcript_12843/g.17194 Transcript_12843/m.17194 type:complete len:294 (+) Transcript_12843:114-995(+)